MGNSATKESKQAQARSRIVDAAQSASPSGSEPSSPALPPPLQQRNQPHAVYSGRTGRSSRTDLSSLLGIRNGPPSESYTPQHRRVSKQERESKKLEIERAEREKERERSMREEHVDGGYLVTQGVYTGTEDFNKIIVRQLMVRHVGRVAAFELIVV